MNIASKLTMIATKSAKYAAIAMLLSGSAMHASSQTPDYSEGWYQIKRTVNIASFADLDLSNISSSLSAMTSLLSNVSYLTTDEEFTAAISIPVINLKIGTAVYGAKLLAVDGLKDYTADLSSENGRNANEKELSTYYYITPVGADDDGLWRYTVRSVNGHYMGPDGRYYVEPKEVYFNSSIGISLGDSADAALSSLTSMLGVSVGSKQYTVSASLLDEIPYIDQLEIYNQLKPLIETLGDLGVKISLNSWAKTTVENSKSTENESIDCIGSTDMLTMLSAIAQDAEQLLSYVNDEDYTSLGRELVKYVGLDLFKLKKVNINNITTSTGWSATHTSVTPYTINLLGFGDNFSLTTTDYRTTDSLTKLSQKTDQNAMVEYLGDGAQDKSNVRFYDGGTLFIKKGGEIGDSETSFNLLSDNGTDIIDLSKAQSKVMIDYATKNVYVILSSPQQTSIMGIPSGRWTDNYKTVNLSEAGFATLYSPFEIIIPGDEQNGSTVKSAPKVYIPTKLADNKLICEALTERIPANTPAIIKGDNANSYNFVVVESDATTATPVAVNLLSGTIIDSTIPQNVTAYQLTTTANGMPLMTLAKSESDIIPAWSAYFASDIADTNTSYQVMLNSEESGIEIIRDTTLNSANDINSAKYIYDIYGRPIYAEPKNPGIYIINGAKVLIK